MYTHYKEQTAISGQDIESGDLPLNVRNESNTFKGIGIWKAVIGNTLLGFGLWGAKDGSGSVSPQLLLVAFEAEGVRVIERRTPFWPNPEGDPSNHDVFKDQIINRFSPTIREYIRAHDDDPGNDNDEYHDELFDLFKDWDFDGEKVTFNQ